MDAPLGLAIESCVVETSSLIIALIKKINEVRVFKDKCIKLYKEVSLLHELLDRKRSAVGTLHTIHSFKSCIRKVENFVDSCRTWSISTVGLEVFVRHEYPSLLKELNALRDIFVFDSVTEILVREGVAFRKLLAGQDSQNEIMRNLQKNMEERDRREHQLSSATLSRIQPDFYLDHTFRLTFDANEPFYGKGTLENVGPIICYPIQPSKVAKENLDIYCDLQEGAYVQRFHGTLSANKTYYAVMEDLTGEMTLNQACLKDLTQSSLLERARLASDLAKSMAWFHKADLLLKSVTDQTVVLKRLPSGKLCPVLTNLENLRNKTSSYEYDIRYEAPEYHNRREHSAATDVWSLGIVLWQCIFCQVPYGAKKHIYKETDECEAIRKRLRKGDMPGSLGDARETFKFRDLIQQCWRRDPMYRTTADAVARSLQGLSASLALPNISEDHELLDSKVAGSLAHCDLDEVQQKALIAVQEARLLNKTSPKFVQSASRISKEDFSIIMDGDNGSNPVISFIVGAAFWWNLTDFSFEEANDYSTLATSLTSDGKRVTVALKYLEYAVRSRYSPAYLEMYKAHAFLAREFQKHLSY
ncbi:hypothetical protein BDZ45DRAFT_676994 [Acephala macrosclerotiorum]|nr:hypothetical protein BDZ45DRAFT_676994 [Acephala macrosclerotiorum]